MRTAHLIVSGIAFTVWSAASGLYFVMCSNSATDEWYLYGPAAVLPSFWCLYAWFASRRAKPFATFCLFLLALPSLIFGLGFSLIVVDDVTASPPDGLTHPIGMGVAMIGGGCWFPILMPGLVSFVWAISIQIKCLRQPSEEV